MSNAECTEQRQPRQPRLQYRSRSAPPLLVLRVFVCVCERERARARTSSSPSSLPDGSAVSAVSSNSDGVPVLTATFASHGGSDTSVVSTPDPPKNSGSRVRRVCALGTALVRSRHSCRGGLGRQVDIRAGRHWRCSLPLNPSLPGGGYMVMRHALPRTPRCLVRSFVSWLVG